jgi:ribosome-binding protein aMBF1 (putative translation factor)
MKTPTELQLDRERERYRRDMQELASAHADLLIDYRRAVRERDAAEIQIEELSQKLIERDCACGFSGCLERLHPQSTCSEADAP